MSQTDPTISKLLQLKRYEQPEEGFTESFVKEFQKRQRSELLQKSSVSLFLERFKQWNAEYKSWAWSGAALTALALGVLGLPLIQSNSSLPQSYPAFVVSDSQAAKDAVPISRAGSIDLLDYQFGESHEVLPVKTVASFEF